MAVTVATFKSLFPEFASLPSTRIQLFLDQAARRVNRTQWGARADDGISYLSAHMLCISGQAGGGASGPIQSESVEGASVSYAVASTFSASELGSTGYGRTFLTLRSEIFTLRCL